MYCSQASWPNQWKTSVSIGCPSEIAGSRRAAVSLCNSTPPLIEGLIPQIAACAQTALCSWAATSN